MDPSRTHTVSRLLRHAAARLVASSSPLLDAQVLLAQVLDCSRSHLIAWPDKTVSESAVERFEALVSRRANGEPVAYLTGCKEFWSMELAVTPDTLVPRPDTEVLVARALELIPQHGRYRVADLGTGSGAVAIAIASERPEIEVFATDLSAPALDVAKRNAARHRLANIQFLQGDWLAPLSGRVLDLVVSNPPYVNSTDPCLAAGETAFEPRSALSAGRDGLDAIRHLAAAVPGHLATNARVLLEHGSQQADEVAQLLRDAGLHNVKTHADLAGLPRCTEAQRLAG